jgi:hypothetical protein
MDDSTRLRALRFVLLIKTIFCFAVWGLPSLFGPPAFFELLGLTMPDQTIYLRVLGSLVVALGVLYGYGYKDPLENIVVVKFGVVDNGLATLVILFIGLTSGVSWFFWTSAVFTTLFFLAFVLLFPRTTTAPRAA